MNVSGESHTNRTSTANTAFKLIVIAICTAALLTNVALTMAIVRAKRQHDNRHIYVYYLSLLFAHLVFALGNITASISSIYTRVPSAPKLTELGCTLVNLPFFTGNLMYTGVLLSISIDRFVVVRWPVFYRLHIRQLQRSLLCVVFSLTASLTIGGLAGVSTTKYVPFCGIADGLTGNRFWAFVILVWAGTMSVSTFYAASIISLKCYQRSRSCGTGMIQTEVERAFTRSAMLLVAVELCTATLGRCGLLLAFSVVTAKDVRFWLSQVSLLCVELNVILNPVVIISQNKELFDLFKQQFICKRRSSRKRQGELYVASSELTASTDTCDIALQALETKAV